MNRLHLCARHATGSGEGLFHIAAPVGSAACPSCRAESLPDERTGTSVEDLNVLTGRQAATPFAMSPRVALALDEWETRRRASGYVEPGSVEEAEVLAEMDDLRPSVIEDDHLTKAQRRRRIQRRRGYSPPAFRMEQFR